MGGQCFYLYCIVFLLIISTYGHKLPIVYVYTVVPAVCKYGLPEYIKVSLEQAIYTQPDCDVILVSNFAECLAIKDSVKDVDHLILVDSTQIITDRTTNFKNESFNMFQSDGFGELWVTSALRFFIMEDLFYANKYSEMMHIEADNLLYGPYTSILPILRSGYKGLAATPLNAQKSFITASVLWISDLEAIIKFNDYMLALANNTANRWLEYLQWLRLNGGCCKQGGINPDKDGKGVKPYAINEMSMLAYYHELYPKDFHLLPVVPAYNYITNKYVCNMSDFGPGGRETGPATGHGVWDANSWGQYLGGTSQKRGRDVGFTDSSHISGQAMRLNNCKVEMVCGNQTTAPYAPREGDDVSRSKTIVTSSVTESTTPIKQQVDMQVKSSENNSTNNRIHFWNGLDDMNRRQLMNKHNSHHHPHFPNNSSSINACYTAPFIRCGGVIHEWLNATLSPYTPLWNLHVHSKHTEKFRSRPCPCVG